MDNQVIGIAALYIVVELIKRILPMIAKKHIKGFICPYTAGKGLNAEEHNWLKTLMEMHAKTDDDGRPVWYVPKNVNDSLVQITHAMSDLTHSQERISDTLEKIANKIN